MAYDYSGVDPDVVVILRDIDARQTALEAKSLLIVSHTITLEGGRVLTYNLVK
jgi:hypothetical protein